MSKTIDHTKLNSRLRGLRDHDYAEDYRLRTEKLKEDTKQFAARLKSGKKNYSKTARRSGKVVSITGEAAAAIAAAYNAAPPRT